MHQRCKNRVQPVTEQNDSPSDKSIPVKQEQNIFEQDSEDTIEEETINWAQTDDLIEESGDEGFEAAYFENDVAKEWIPTKADPTLFSVRKWPPYGVPSKKNRSKKDLAEPSSEALTTSATETSDQMEDSIELGDDIKIQPFEFDEPAETLNISQEPIINQNQPPDDDPGFFISS